MRTILVHHIGRIDDTYVFGSFHCVVVFNLIRDLRQRFGARWILSGPFQRGHFETNAAYY